MCQTPPKNSIAFLPFLSHEPKPYKSFPPSTHHLFHSSHISQSLCSKSQPLVFSPPISLSCSYLSSTFIQPNRSHGCSDSLSALLPPHPVPEATWYRGQCNPAIRNLLLNPFSLPRLNTKRCPNTSWKKKKLRSIAQQALLREESRGWEWEEKMSETGL